MCSDASEPSSRDFPNRFHIIFATEVPLVAPYHNLYDLKQVVLFCSLSAVGLPAGLADAGDLALVSQLAEADTADAVVAQVSVGTAADLAAVVLTGRELGRSLLLENHRFLSH